MSTGMIKNFYQTIAQQVPTLLPYQFLLTIVPGETWLKNLVNWQRLQLLCRAADIPENAINTSNVNYFGKNFHVPTAKKNNHEWSTELIITNNMDSYHELRKLMLQFSNLENNLGGRRTVPNLDIDVEVLNQFSEVDTTQPKVVLKGAFPTTLANLPLKYEESSNLITVNVTFTYQYFFYDMAHDKNETDSLKPGNVAPVAPT